ncbi:hypothetical protein Bca4012_035895 [Brassica carinata]|uniref:Uncharacterized protein n=1 Tax=Brassica carinata TaxID=52824 RepID=A0A8X7WD63_BRACI|nr:hypothetical protein Bca52824_009718 [Brassica carinata]
MVLVTHQFQGSHVLFTWSSATWTKDLVIKTPVTTLHFTGRKEKHLRLKSKIVVLGENPTSHVPAVTSFKGGIQNSESGGSERGKKVSINSVKLYYRPDDVVNNVDSSSKTQNTSQLFKKWSTLLLKQSPIQVIHEAVGEPQTTKPETETEQYILDLLWSLDAAIKIPLLLFVPGFLAVNAIYGTEVTKELSPLWIAGLSALDAFCFNQTTKVIRNLPSYYIIAFHYISHGKLRDHMRALVTPPMVAIKNTDYRELTRTKLKQPYYCRNIRFLKRANLIWSSST